MENKGLLIEKEMLKLFCNKNKNLFNININEEFIKEFTEKFVVKKKKNKGVSGFDRV